MGIDVNGKNVRLWVNERESKDGRTWNEYALSLGKRKKDGDGWINGKIKASFSRDVLVPDGLPNGVRVDFEGYVSLNHYVKNDGAEVKDPMIVITKATFIDYTERRVVDDDVIDGFAELDADIPF